jgi:hypothetical protein
MKVLSVRQPWAWLIVNGYKDIENRTWHLRYRGSLLIHAGKAWDESYSPECPEWFQEEINSLLCGVKIPGPEELQRGGIVGMVDVVGCCTGHNSRWFEGPHGIVMRNQKPLPFVPCKGRLGLFDFDYEEGERRNYILEEIK